MIHKLLHFIPVHITIPSMDRHRDAGKTETDLAHLRALSTTAPRTKMGQVVWAWPEIQASLSGGRNLREIWEALQLDGIQMSYDQFRVYVSRIRRRLNENPAMIPHSGLQRQDMGYEALTSVASGIGTTPSPTAPVRDPLSNIRREQERKRASGFTYNPLMDGSE